MVRWIYAQVKMAGGLEGIGDEAGDLPLYLSAGRFGVIAASIGDSAGIGASLVSVGDAWL